MESRKKRNLEIERAKRKKLYVLKGIMAAVMVAVLAAIAYASWDTVNSRTIMVVNGERVSSSDFRFLQSYFGMPQGEDTQNALTEHLTQTLVMLDRARQSGFEPSAAEMAVYLGEAREIREQMDIRYISENRIAELLMLTRDSFEFLVDTYVPDEPEFEFDEEEIEMALAAQMDWILINTTEMEIKFIMSDDLSELEEAAERYNAGTEFDELIAEKCLIYSVTEEIAVVDAMEFIMDNNAWGSMGGILTLNEGEMFGPLESTEGVYFMVQAQTVERDYEEIERQKEEARGIMINQRREDEIERDLSWRREQIYSQETEMEIKFIMSDNFSDLTEAAQVYDLGFATFDELKTVHCQDYAVTDELEPVDFMEFLMQNQAWGSSSDIITMNQDEIFGPFETLEDTFFIVQAYRVERDEEDIQRQVSEARESVISDIAFQKRADIFRDVLLQTWVEEAQIRINNRALIRF
jgi:hypothetical protein